MPSYRYLLLCLALVLCLQSVAAAPHVVHRQDDGPSVTGGSSIQPSATVTPSGVSSRPKTESHALSVKPSATATTVIPASVSTASSEPTPTGSADADSENPLPIHPKLTPAMGLSGVILLLTGLVYAIIGIKNKWIYVFGSAAYLTALAVTVLIVYLMSPPVANAIQGAFFVAALVTGVIFGVLSLVFSDITEGFGCLLGGFCLSMWFLSLRDGGLIASATGRAIFIGCMSAGGYSVSFSHYTRTYGLIVSIAFSGATATILGIDCLAGAGWKEFWLYLWNLNDNVFPLHTDTYPLTKNIKAELAGVVIIAVFGVVSQMRVWNLVKEHRAKSAAQEIETQQDQEREEEALGRKIEDNIQKERAQWEAAYGDRNKQDSSIRSSITNPKGSVSIRETEVHGHDSMELVDISKGGRMQSTNVDTPAGTTVTISILKDDDDQQVHAQDDRMDPKHVEEPVASNTSGTAPSHVAQPIVTDNSNLRPSIPPPPVVVPLPFTVPKEEDAMSEEEDKASVSALAETEHEADFIRVPMSKRVSDMSAMRHHTLRDLSGSEEALINMPHVEDDRASSVAATLDDDLDVISIESTTHHGQPASFQPRDSSTFEENMEQGNPTGKDAEHVGLSRPTIQHSLTTSTDPKPDEPQVKRSSLRNSQAQVDTLVHDIKGSSEEQQSQSTKSDALSQGEQTELAEHPVASLKDRVLPEKLSKVALSYRTNEWAKHLEAADKPDVDEVPYPTSPGVVVVKDGPEEEAAAVSDEIASPLMGSKRGSRRTSVESRAHRNSGSGLYRSTSNLSHDSLGQRAVTRASPEVSSGVLSRSNSGTQLDALSPLPSKTLMGKREKLVKNRTSSQSLTPYTSSANLLLEQSEEDSMTLAQRRQLLQQTPSPLAQHQAPMASHRKSPPLASQKWAKKGLTAKGAPAGFDSHQPKRMSSSQSAQKQEQLYAGWRDNMRDVTPPQTAAAYMAEQQRVALMKEKRQKEMDMQQHSKMQQQQASKIDSMMRSGHMLGAHREAMRKMQANANKHT